MRHAIILSCGLLICCLGCAGNADNSPTQLGFLSDYSRLTAHGNGARRFVSPKLKDYPAFLIEPSQLRAAPEARLLKPEDAAKAVAHLDDQLARELTKRGYKLTMQPYANAARVRMAFGGGIMEGEIVDSMTGEQLAAVVQPGKGGEFKLRGSSTLKEVEEAADRWAQAAADRLDELHGQAGRLR